MGVAVLYVYLPYLNSLMDVTVLHVFILRAYFSNLMGMAVLHVYFASLP